MADLASAGQAVLLSPEDDVATVLADVQAGARIALRHSASGKIEDVGLVARERIPFGHKVARRVKSPGENLIRYGQPIGVVRRTIAVGDHVHAHNLASALSPVARSTNASSTPVLRTAAWLKSAIIRCLAAAGAAPDAAAHMAEALVEAHLRGVETHGLRRLAPYVARLRKGGVDGKAVPEIARHGALLRIDGRNAIGHHVAAVAADAAVEAARELGVGIALVRNSNHFGFAGYYATRMATAGCFAIVTSNGQVCVTPPGGRKPIFSNDPVAIAAPLGADRFLELDMATSVTSRARIAEAAERGRPIATGLALDADGNPTEDAAAALTGSLLPVGGERGFALLFAIEALTGVLTGGAYADLVSSKEAAPGAPEGTAHAFIAIDIDGALGRDQFQRRLEDLAHRVSAVPMRPDVTAPRFPGERRWRLRAERLRDGIPLAPDEDATLLRLAQELGAPVN